ncbi:MAG: ROK family protein [Chloroflexi bacterium]|nr:ROK family protein [Chloroflexota bacterium]MCC6892140.1 ROK family protein [Anaerolineae bacterium]
MQILGIDIGGSGIKGAPVEIDTGEMVTERFRIPTPNPADPNAVADVVRDIVKNFQWKGPIGCTFPAIVRRGVVESAANVDKSWIGTDGQKLIQKKTKCPTILLNDADAAGIAEMQFGAGRGNDGVVFMLTLGTGIGSAIFNKGVLLPNTELGHLEVRGKDAELRASDRTRQEKELDWAEWGERLNEYIARLEYLFSPDLFIIGGGVSKKSDKFLPYIRTVHAEIVTAQLLNDAGIVGAAMAASVLAG